MTNIQLCEKRRAILDTEGHILITGGPGSGKTTTAILKAQKRTKDLQPGQEVLFLSFSRAAVQQILHKSTDLLPQRDRFLIQVQTYHSFCIRSLISHGRLLSGLPCRFIYPIDERLLKSEYSGDWDQERTRRASQAGLYCFDLVARGAADLFERCEAVRKLYGGKFPLIIVDEFQDSDNDQWRIVRALASVTDVVCLADPEQRIFEYRQTVNPHRLEEMRAELSLSEFDLGTENHRSPAAGIVRYADSVLYNRSPLPVTGDVSVITYRGRDFAVMVHATVFWTLSELHRRGIADPTMAVMCRSNSFVADLSTILREEHKIKGKRLPPIEHNVIWDAELSAAAAAVVASILGWSQRIPTALASSFQLISRYYQLRNAERPSKASRENGRKYREAAELLASGRESRLKAVKKLSEVFNKGLAMLGDPVKDWRAARDVLQHVSDFVEIFRAASMVRLFGARDVLAAALAEQWVNQGHYGNASDVVKSILDREHLLSLERAPRGCTLMTIHKSKGKEFDCVVLVEGAFKSPFFDPRERPPHDKSRRLLRVGLTRARSIAKIVRPEKAQPLVDKPGKTVT